MTQSLEFPQYAWVPPKSYTKGRKPGQPSVIIIHATDGSEGRTSAEDGAAYDARRTDGTSTHFFCVSPETRILTADMRWVAAAEIGVEDELVGFDEFAVAGAKRQLRQAYVTSATTRIAERVRIELADGRVLVSSADHRWLTWTGGNYKWREARRFRAGQRLCAPLRPWEPARAAADAGWLAGIFDGEGCFNQAPSQRTLSFAQREGAVLDQGMDILDRMGLAYKVQEKRTNGVTVVQLSGLQSLLQFLGQCRTIRFLERPELWAGKSLSGTRLYPGQMEIVAVEPAGPGEVVSISTTTRTFIAEGVASHNCDQDSTIQCVLTSDEAHAARLHGNDVGVQVEICGKAGQSAAQWADAASAGAIEQCARLCVALRKRYGTARFPLRNLTPAQLRAGENGFAEHRDATLAWPADRGTHEDPGPNFPWDRLFARIRELEKPPAPTPPKGTAVTAVMTQAEFDDHLRKADVVPRYAGGAPVPPTDANPTTSLTNVLGYISGVVQRLEAKLDELGVHVDAVGADAAACKALLLKHTADDTDQPS